MTARRISVKVVEPAATGVILDAPPILSLGRFRPSGSGIVM